MEVFDFDYGWRRIRARLGKTGSVYIDLPSRSGYNGGEFRETIVLEDRGWRFTSLQYDCIDYFFHMWMDDQGNMSYANDMTRGIEYMREPYNPNYPNAGVLDDTAELLYTVSHTIREYQKRNLPVEEVFELRKLYLKVALKTLGYDTIDSVAEPLDDSRGYLGLNKVVDCLENYLDLSILVHSIGKYGDDDQIKCRALKEVTREQILDEVRPVKEQIDELVAFMQRKEDDLKDKRTVLPEYRNNMKEKIGDLSFEEYEEKVRAVAMLLLELNADLLTEEQRNKLGIKELVLCNDIDIKDKISRVIDSEEFNLACRIEDEFAYDESEELVNAIKNLKPSVNKKEGEFTREEIVEMLSSELEEFEERRDSVDLQEGIRKKYYTRPSKKQNKIKVEEEYVY